MVTNLHNSPAIVEQNDIFTQPIIGNGAITRCLEERKGKLLRNNSNIKINQPRTGNIDTDSFDREPKEKLLSRNTRNLRNLTIIKGTRHGAIITQMGFELGGTGLRQMYLKASWCRIYWKIGDSLGQKTNREAMWVENVINGRWWQRNDFVVYWSW